MAPARSARRAHSQNAAPPSTDPHHAALFLEPMMGAPLTIYIEKDVDDRDDLVDLITVRIFALPIIPLHHSPQKHGGAVSPSYSGTPYILGKSIDLQTTTPLTPHQSTPIKSRVRTCSASMRERRARSFCIHAGSTSVFGPARSRHSRTIGQAAKLRAPKSSLPISPSISSSPANLNFTRVDPPSTVSPQNDPPPVSSLPPIPPHPQAIATMQPTDPLVHPPPQGSYGYPVYAHPIQPHPRGMQPPTAAPPQSWQAPNAIAPQQAHMAPPQPPSALLPRPTQPYRDGPWVTGFEQPPPHMVAGPSGPPYGYRYRDEQTDWATAPPNDYTYDPATVSL